MITVGKMVPSVGLRLCICRLGQVGRGCLDIWAETLELSLCRPSAG